MEKWRTGRPVVTAARKAEPALGPPVPANSSSRGRRACAYAPPVGERSGGDWTLRLVTGTLEDEKHDADEHSKLVLEAMRRIADEQLERAERVRNTARNT